MIYFNSDYTEGAHPKVLDMLIKTNMEQTTGYSEDEYCKKARSLIKKACKNDDIDVHFLVGGTQANFTVISASLRPHQGVISAVTGHIHAHETGAVEATGHKIIALPCGADGKITAEQVADVYTAHVEDTNFEHLVQPKMVYISHPTESGAIYSNAELTAISKVCKDSGLLLFVDGARLGYGLSAKGSDVTLKDLCELTDAFYIGGTKVGAMFGEAVVISNSAIKQDFRYIMKQKGAMLAKGRLLGVQFSALFEDELYFEIAKKADEQAYKIADACKEAGLKMFSESVTNQQFIIFPKSLLEDFGKKYAYSFWEKFDDNNSVIRLCTSWATTDENLDQLISDIKNLKI